MEGSMSSSSVTYNYKDPLNLLASIIMIVNGIFGSVCNLSIVYIFMYVPKEKTSFNLICVFRSLGNTIILLWGFIATFVPITLTGQSQFWKPYETVVIISCNNIYMVIQYSGVFIAVNRFCALFLPIVYKKLFHIKTTFILTMIIIALKLIDNLNYLITFLPIECFTFYSSNNLAWVPNIQSHCHIDDNVPNPFNSTAFVLIVIIFINVANFIRIRMFYKSTETEVAEKKRKMKKNTVLFGQTLFQDCIMLFDMLFTFKLAGISKERYWTFFSGTLVWELVHSLDGFVMVMFNERLSFLKNKMFHPSNDVSHTQVIKVVSARY